MVLSPDAAIEAHFAKPSRGAPRVFFSALRKGLEDCRGATNRDIKTGRRLGSGEHDSWVGALGYFALLDQIGNCFSLVAHRAGRPNGENAIVSALCTFSSLGDKEISALYALRCAFAHDFSLFNKHPANPDLTHCFHLFPEPEGALVTLPKIPWNGEFANRPQECWTAVGLTLLGDLVEDICVRLWQLHKEHKLKIKLAGGADELNHRYGVMKTVKAA